MTRAVLELAAVPTLRAGFALARLPDGTALLVGERERFLLTPIAGEVMAQVDGQRSVDQILCSMRGRLGEVKALAVLHQLVANGRLAIATPEAPAPVAAFWAGLDARAITATRVAVDVLGDVVPRDWLCEALRGAGLQIADDADCHIVATDDYLRPELAGFDARARRTGARWCVLQPSGARPLIGPVLGAPDGPCWTCLAFWIAHNRPVEALVRQHTGGAFALPHVALEASLRAACNLAALAFARAVAAPAQLTGRLVAVDLADLSTSAHAVVRRPQCPSCGNPARMAVIGERVIALNPVEIGHRDDGGYRQCAPRETFARFAHLVSPITGPISHVTAMPGRDSELRAVYASGYLVRPRLPLRGNAFDRACAGKGRTADQARVSALCEAIERYSGVFQGDEARVRASRAELGDVACDPGQLLLFSDAQYRAYDPAVLVGDAMRTIPARLAADTPIEWTPAWSLSQHARRYVPLTYCYSDAPLDAGVVYCPASGNGVAAGTCFEEAVLQAVLELVERDAIAVWWYNRLRRPGVEFAQFVDSYFTALIADYTRLGWTTWALDLTHDLGIPVYAALAHEPHADRFAIGFGCHVEPRLALQRALTELNQLFHPGGSYRAPWDHARLPRAEFLFPDAAASSRTPGAPPPAGDLLATIDHCLSLLNAAGLEVIAVDKTRPDLGLAVAQVIVPGLRHFWPRFAPGRLYDVPCALGWRAAPLDEAELNPVPLFV